MAPVLNRSTALCTLLHDLIDIQCAFVEEWRCQPLLDVLVAHARFDLICSCGPDGAYHPQN